jgi:glycosyltransferase involved in cell wall biosynthesis
VSDELSSCLDEVCAHSSLVVRRVRLPENRGLAAALEAGLHACTHDVVARMDADDVSLPQRFALQLPLLDAGAVLVGGGLLEIGGDELDVIGRRVPPTTPEVIRRAARLHSPFNHPTVVYRRSAVLAAGGYQDLPLMEDYWLFARMIAAGARVANLPEPLVLYRVGAGAYERRGGRRLLRAELELQRRFLRAGFTTRPTYLRNVALRGTYRLVPAGLRRRAYRLLVATRGEQLEQRAPRRLPGRPLRSSFRSWHPPDVPGSLRKTDRTQRGRTHRAGTGP